MLDALPMADRHAYALERLVEMSGAVVEGAFKRVTQASLPEEKDRAALVFDRLARGLRLTLALEARMARDRRRDAQEIARSDAAPPPATTAERPRRPSTPRTEDPQEADHESEADHETCDDALLARFKDLAGLLDEQADQLDPDGTHRAALAQINARWAKGQTDPDREPSEPEVQRRRGPKRLRRRDPDAPPSPGPPRRRSG